MAETKVQHQTTSRGLVWRSLGMLRAVRGLIVVLFLLGVVASALPYVSAAAFGPMVQVVADAGTSGNLSGVWDLQGPLVAREDGLLGSLAGPVPFAVLLATWAASLLLAQLMYFVNAWVGAKVDRVLLVDIRQRVHDHLQSLSLDFFTGSRTGELMQRVTTESAGVQRLLTDCLLPPLIDAVVLAVAIGYLLAISWQMTVAALVLTPLALITLRFAGRHVQAAMRRVMNADRAMAAELEQTVSGISEIQTFNAQSLRSKRFHEVSEHAAKSDASICGLDAGHGERVSGVRRAQHGRGVAGRHRVQRKLRSDVRRPDGVHRNGPDDVRGGATGHGRVHHVPVGGAERGVDLRVARHPPVGPGTRGRRRARRRARQPRVRGRDVRLHAGANRSRRVVVLDRRRRDGGPGRWHRVGQVDGVQPRAAVPGSAAGPDSARWPRHRGGHHRLAARPGVQARPVPVLHQGHHPREHPVGAAGRQRRRRRGGVRAGPRPLRHHRPDEAARRLRHGGGRAGAVRRTEATHRAGALPVAQARGACCSTSRPKTSTPTSGPG